ncbi:UNVERIFIED_CONTAM: hypothetical protein K2H54_005502 [Gekko kuhli]
MVPTSATLGTLKTCEASGQADGVLKTVLQNPQEAAPPARRKKQSGGRAASASGTSSAGPSGDQNELVVRIANLETENRNLCSVVTDLQLAISRLETRLSMLEKASVSHHPSQTPPTQPVPEETTAEVTVQVKIEIEESEIALQLPANTQASYLSNASSEEEKLTQNTCLLESASEKLEHVSATETSVNTLVEQTVTIEANKVEIEKSKENVSDPPKENPEKLQNESFLLGEHVETKESKAQNAVLKEDIALQKERKDTDVVVTETNVDPKKDNDFANEGQLCQFNTETVTMKMELPAGSLARQAESPAAEDDDDDDIDLFGSDDEEEDQEAARVREERLRQYSEKKSKKPGLIAKSSILLDVKPWDDETDMAKMEECVRTIQMDGLVWGASKLVPVGYGIKKLQIQCVVEDDKVGTDILEEEITKFEDYVQSVDIAAFNKI